MDAAAHRSEEAGEGDNLEGLSSHRSASSASEAATATTSETSTRSTASSASEAASEATARSTTTTTSEAATRSAAPSASEASSSSSTSSAPHATSHATSLGSLFGVRSGEVFGGHQLFGVDEDLVANLEAVRLDALCRLDSEVDVVDRTEDFVQLADFVLVLKEDRSIEHGDLGVGRLVDHILLCGVDERAHLHDCRRWARVEGFLLEATAHR